MSSSPFTNFGVGIAVMVAVWSSVSNVGAETALSDFSGAWNGEGTDRSTPFETAQRTVCKMLVRADLRHMTGITHCIGQYGLSKMLRLTITLDGDQFSGVASQTSTTRGSTKTLSGSVIGRKTADAAAFQIQFPGLTPNAEVVLARVGPSAFSMRVTSLGFTLTDLIFRQPIVQ